MTYDGGSGLLKTVSEANSLGTTSYDYDDQGRLKDYTPPIPSGYSVGPITYNNLDEKMSVPLNEPGGVTKTTSYSYYEDGTLKNLTWPSTSSPTIQAAYQYYRNGRREQTILGNLGNGYYQTNYGYDSRNRMTDIAHYHSAGAPWNGTRIAEISYGTNLDEQGNPKQIDEYDDAGGGHHFVNTYQYDEWNRLHTWTYNGNTETWNYDWVGNWLNGPVSTDTYTTDPKVDELMATSTPNYTYKYDNRGSLTASLSGGNTVTSYSYNLDELLDDVTTGTATSTMTWDSAGRQLQLNTSGGAIWQFVYQAGANVPAVLAELNGSTEADYVREPGGELVARVASEGNSYYLFDPVGSTIAIVPATEGNPTDRFYYDTWGQIITSDPNGRQSGIGMADNPYRFGGRYGYYYHQQDSNLQNWLALGVRFYNPNLGRFERRDPVADEESSSFSYVSDQVPTDVDPTGRIPFRVPICVQNSSAPHPEDVIEDVEKCIEKNKGNTQKIADCIRGKVEDAGIDAACEIFACLSWDQNENLGGCTTTRKNARGYPCRDAKLDHDKGNYHDADCQTCKDWLKLKCECKQGQSGLADCVNNELKAGYIQCTATATN